MPFVQRQNDKRKIKMLKLPRKISPCPIAEAVVEIRFDSATEADAIFGILYQQVKDKYPNPVEKLPILQLPEEFRSQDANLKRQPYYKLSRDNLSLSIGPKVFSISCYKDYIGWEEFSKVIEETFGIIDTLNIVTQVERFGLRYVNFFEEMDIFDNIVVQITKNDQPMDCDGKYIRVKNRVDQITSTIQIANKAKLRDRSDIGSIIDIDVSVKEPVTFFENRTQLIENCHELEKKSFFELLTKNFLETLNPEY